MTRFEKRKQVIDWQGLSDWEDNNSARIIWAVDVASVRERMKELGKSVKVSNDLILEFVTHTRRSWDMDMFKQSFLDFVILKLEEEYNES
jgi:hypothetical protein